jgi:hypothetical protein
MTNAGRTNGPPVILPSVADEMRMYDRCPPEIRAALREAPIEYSAAQALFLIERQGWTMDRVIEALKK